MRLWAFLAILLVLPLCWVGAHAEEGSRPVVTTSYGDVQGFQKKSVMYDVSIDAFLGIPYASPPVGPFRFAQPIPPESWNGTRDASMFGNECYQVIIPEEDFHISDEPLPRTEDCLYLNIYRPSERANDPLAVMVYIHGGVYYMGAGSRYEGSELAANGVIIVTINYRLGVFGFLSNGDDVIPGNYGALDQVMALKWVKDNIQAFGGDPNKVTIFGQSSGAASVSMLVLSPLAEGLFQRAIMAGGVSTGLWATSSHPSRYIAPHTLVRLIGAVVGCVQNDAGVKLECLRRVDAENVFIATKTIQDILQGGTLLAPAVETKFGFLPALPVDLWTQNKFNHVETMRGYNKAEGAAFILHLLNANVTKDVFIHALKTSLLRFSVRNIDQFVAELYDTYVEKNDNPEIMDLVDALGDISMIGPTLLEGDLETDLAPEKNHYMYVFDHYTDFFGVPKWLPVTHTFENAFIFGIELKYLQLAGKAPSADDVIVSKNFQKLFTNFAKYGKPTESFPIPEAKWPRYTATRRGFKIGVINEEYSFKSHRSLTVFNNLLSRLETAIQELFMII